MSHIALYGGTFDPIHQGHINTSLAIQNHMHFDSYRFLPCKIPALKAPAHATTNQRLTMLQLALSPYPQFELDLREINRATPSYMVDTLTSVREELPHASISLILGYDAFMSLPQWHQWEKIVTLANILVMNRNKQNLSQSILTPQDVPLVGAKNIDVRSYFYQMIKSHYIENKTDFLKQKAGAIYEYDAGFYPISSTHIRELLKESHEKFSMAARTNERLIPEKVYAYIKQQGLYQ